MGDQAINPNDRSLIGLNRRPRRNVSTNVAQGGSFPDIIVRELKKDISGNGSIGNIPAPGPTGIEIPGGQGPSIVR